MERNQLFPQISGILHGGDYNPEQWLDHPEILQEDIQLMKKAGMTSATLGVFAWSTYEPVEGEYHFDWHIEIMDRLYENGIYTILATPSGAKPTWLARKYPDVLRVDAYGQKAHQGIRHNHCMSSMIYRQKVHQLLEHLGERVKNHPGLIMWHISNEFGGECFCPNCVKRFQTYLEEKFDHDIQKLNKAWWTTFWSHTYQDFSEIEPPFTNGETSIMGLNLEWKRFTTWNTTDYMKSEISYLKQITPNLPVTTNFMELFYGLDYRVMAKELDVISWDSYPIYHNDSERLADTFARNAFNHAVMRSMKRDKPFMLMESAPGLVNWQAFNKMRRPGVHRLSSMHAIACGSDTVQYFQWRKGRGSFEQYHGAVVSHLGTDDTRIFKEVSSLGKELKELSAVQGSLVDAKVAIVFDWDTMWAIDDMKGLADSTKKYDKTCIDIYHAFLQLGVDVDVISSEDSLKGYQLVILPMLYMLQNQIDVKLERFVKNGGHILATYLTGYVDENQLCFMGGFPGNGLTNVFGVTCEEIDTLYPQDKNEVLFTDGTKGEVRDYAEVLRTDDVEVLATYQHDYYAGMPAVTAHSYGNGMAYYVAARFDNTKMKELFADILEKADIPYEIMPEGVEKHTRTADGKTYEFYLNITEKPQELPNRTGYQILEKKELNGTLSLDKYGVAIIEKKG